MYHLYVGNPLGTTLVIETPNGSPKMFVGMVLKSNIPGVRINAASVCHRSDYSALKCEDVETAIEAYKKESKRVRRMQIINSQFKDT